MACSRRTLTYGVPWACQALQHAAQIPKQKKMQSRRQTPDAKHSWRNVLSLNQADAYQAKDEMYTLSQHLKTDKLPWSKFDRSRKN